MALELQDLEQLENRMERMLKPHLENIGKQIESVAKAVEDSTNRARENADKLFELDRHRQEQVNAMRQDVTIEIDTKVKSTKDEIVSIIDKGKAATTAWIGIALAAACAAAAVGIFK
jgi:DNA anti-recombination protein RmuC